MARKKSSDKISAGLPESKKESCYYIIGYQQPAGIKLGYQQPAGVKLGYQQPASYLSLNEI